MPQSDRYAVMWSGGKDSCLALWRARNQGLQVDLAVNFFDDASSRVRFHALRTTAIAVQVESMGMELLQVGTGPDDYDARFSQTLEELRARNLRGVVFGNIHLEEVRRKCETAVSRAGLLHIEPLWGESPVALLGEFVHEGFQASLTSCQLDRLGPEWLGRSIDSQFIADITRMPRVDPCGENGEYHSCVTAGPLFREPLVAEIGESRTTMGFAQVDVILKSRTGTNGPGASTGLQ